MERKKTEFIKTENRIVIAKGEVWGVAEMGEDGQKVQNFRYKISSGNVMYCMVSIVNNAILYIWKLLREIDLKSSYHKKNIVTICGDVY